MVIKPAVPWRAKLLTRICLRRSKVTGGNCNEVIKPAVPWRAILLTRVCLCRSKVTGGNCNEVSLLYHGELFYSSRAATAIASW